MKKLIASISILFVSVVSFGQGQTYVHGYTKSNGTYVEGHYRTLPNNTRNDNWSTLGNTNPYTGMEGTKPGGSNYSTTYNSISDYYSSPISSYSKYSTSSRDVIIERSSTNSFPDFSNYYSTPSSYNTTITVSKPVKIKFY